MRAARLTPWCGRSLRGLHAAERFQHLAAADRAAYAPDRRTAVRGMAVRNKKVDPNQDAPR